jgi:S1-C subfamily serine protease
MDEIRIDDNERIQTQNEPANHQRRPGWFRLLAAVLVVAFIGGFGGVYTGYRIIGPPNAEAAQEITISPSDGITTVSAVAKKAMSSVVGITTVETRYGGFFFSEQDVSGVGSGVIVNSDGYILTNSHVVADGNAKELKVLFDDDQELDGVVLWNDPLLDLAVVKVEKTGLVAAELGDSDQLQVGELAVAIGNPLGLEFERTVTSGIISGLNRSVKVDASNIIEGLIQTDASINPGNSGGPLLNSKGEVIGINTAKMTSAEGLGFSIPINQVKTIIDEILQTGSFQGVVMGIKGVSVEEYEARLGIDLSTDEGIVIIEVVPESNAARAGIQNGDIITAIGGKQVETMSQLKRMLYSYDEGDKAELNISRSGEEKIVEIEFLRQQ